MPSIISYLSDGSVGSECFYKNDKCHREDDKRADIYYNTDGSVRAQYFYKNGMRYTPSVPAPCDGSTVMVNRIEYTITAKK